MSLADDRLLIFSLRVRANHPELLAGLEDWLQRGLVTDSEVKLWCATHLSHRLPLSSRPSAVDLEDDFLPLLPSPSPIVATVDASIKSSINSSAGRSPREPATGIRRAMQGLAEEISLRWLLFLGIFLVIVSSGVLAASQWRYFNPSGQYLILLTYTLIFFGVSQWCGQRSQLQLTTQTLKGVSLLLVPVNIWAMDSLHLWQNPLGWGVLVPAVFLLLTITRRLTLTNGSLWGFSALTLLQWGWSVPLWPVIAVYGGVLSTQLNRWLPVHKFPIPDIWQQWGILSQSRLEQAIDSQDQDSGDRTDDRTRDRPNDGNNSPSPLSFLGQWTLWYALAILVLRALFMAKVNLPDLGLAIALAGWFLTHPFPVPRVAEILGMVLLVMGWAITFNTLPWQTIAISGLALVFWGERLQRQWRIQDWLTLMTIALQLGYSLWQAIPAALRETIAQRLITFTGTESTPVALLSLAGFPYVMVLVIAGQWFQVHRRWPLARFTDLFTIAFTSILLTFSLASPCLKTLTFGLATLTTLPTLFRPPLDSQLNSKLDPKWDSRSGYDGRGIPLLSRPLSIYLVHGFAVLTCLFALTWQYPHQSQWEWALLILALTVPHWLLNGFTPTRRSRLWHAQISTLIWGILGSFASYGLFFVTVFDQDIDPHQSLYWGIIPLLLTALGYTHQRSQRRSTFFVGCTIVAVLLLQGLTIGFPALRQYGLGFGGVNLLLCSLYLPRPTLAVLTLGFGLTSLSVALVPQLQDTGVLIYGSILLNALWGFDRLLSTRFSFCRPQADRTALRHQQKLVLIYHQGLQLWGWLIAILLGLIFTLTAIGIWITASAQIPVGIVQGCMLFFIALLHRTFPWRKNRDLYVLAWGVELLLIHSLTYLQAHFSTHPLPLNTLLLGTHLALAIGVEAIGRGWIVRQWTLNPQRSPLSSFKVLPLLWALLGIWNHFSLFTAWSGIATLGIAWVMIQVGRPIFPRRAGDDPPILLGDWQAFTYLGLTLITLGLGELITHPLYPDYNTLVPFWAILGGALAIVYRYLISPYLSAYLCLPSLHLRTAAHLHWGIASGLLLLLPPEFHASESNILYSVGVMLGGYALAQARYQPQVDVARFWTYSTYFHLAGLGFYSWTIAPESLHQGLRVWALAIVAPLCLVLYLLPWQRWGWLAQPWQQLGIGLPLVIAIVTLPTAASGSWLVAAITYAILSYRTRQLRLSYLGLLFLDITAWQWCMEHDRTAFLWYTLPLAISLLWIAAIDPRLQDPQERETRHNLRLLATALICGIVLLPDQGNPWLILGLSLASIFAGLVLRIRAFLYLGTATFVGYSFYQLVVLVAQQSSLKWAIGLVFGIVLIWIAATFETRRDQIRTVLYGWSDALGDWA